MPIPCPRCGQPLERQATPSAANANTGAVGVLFAFAAGQLACKMCGPVDKSKLPPGVRRRLAIESAAMVIAGLLIVGALVFFMSRR